MVPRELHTNGFPRTPYSPADPGLFLFSDKAHRGRLLRMVSPEGGTGADFLGLGLPTCLSRSRLFCVLAIPETRLSRVCLPWRPGFGLSACVLSVFGTSVLRFVSQDLSAADPAVLAFPVGCLLRCLFQAFRSQALAAASLCLFQIFLLTANRRFCKINPYINVNAVQFNGTAQLLKV